MEDRPSTPKQVLLMASLQEKDTQELLQMWEDTVHTGSDPDTIAAIRALLEERSGQVAPPIPAVAEEDPYHSRLITGRVASIANVLSWVVLAISALILIANLSAAVQSPAFFSLMGLLSLLNMLVVLLVGAIAYVILQAISEGLYLLMDIEENTRSRED